MVIPKTLDLGLIKPLYPYDPLQRIQRQMLNNEYAIGKIHTVENPTYCTKGLAQILQLLQVRKVITIKYGIVGPFGRKKGIVVAMIGHIHGHLQRLAKLYFLIRFCVPIVSALNNYALNIVCMVVKFSVSLTCITVKK